MSTAMNRMSRWAAKYGDAAGELRALTREIEDARNAAVRERLVELQRLLKVASAYREKLVDEIEANPGEFVKPRTVTVAGVKFGLRKLPGGVKTTRATLDLIKSKLAGQASVLIRTREEPNKAALMGLSAADLAKIGATLEDSGDKVVCETTIGAVESLVSRMLADAADDE